MEIHIVACFPGSLHTEQIPLLCVGGHFLVDQMGFDMDRTYQQPYIAEGG